MSLENELQKIKTLGVESFNQNLGINLRVDELDMIMKRPVGAEKVVFLFVTKLTSDDLRFQFEVQGFDKYQQIKPFQLKVLKNKTEGNLNSEIYTSSIVLSYTDYKNLFTYLNSKEFLEFKTRSRKILSQSGKPIRTASGFYLFSQN